MKIKEPIECPNCGGVGYIEVDYNGEYFKEGCIRCEGAGTIDLAEEKMRVKFQIERDDVGELKQPHSR